MDSLLEDLHAKILLILMQRDDTQSVENTI
jgi:hypothetical protein